jgi:hypothetical protein
MLHQLRHALVRAGFAIVGHCGNLARVANVRNWVVSRRDYFTKKAPALPRPFRDPV